MMEVLNHLRSSFRGRSSAAGAGSSDSLHSSGGGGGGGSDTNSSSDAASVNKKRARHVCDLCGKRLLKLAGWRNYFTLPCRCRHVFCKQCITDRLQCRQKVLRSASFDLMWTFPCPRSAQCGQRLTVDFSRGSSYSKNLVARDLDCGDDSWDLEEEEEENEVGDESGDNTQDDSDVSVCGHDDSRLREIG
ncbi:uncharacterized protein LOC143301294 [Babylonia areolata]|uniref:uncharacterized protein LOC143301294 n=1 Tax=Babylonia areolata TaxID=304850 RepID=UPI003FD3786A